MTCNEAIWRESGLRMVSSFLEYWPACATLYVYAEGFMPSADVDSPRIVEVTFPPWFLEWKERLRNVPFAHGRDAARNRRNKPYDFRLDCVRFAHKIAAMTSASEFSHDLMIMIDADTVTHQLVGEDWLRGLLRSRGRPYMAWLDRAGTYPECGFLMFDCTHPAHSRFMERLRETYRTGAVLQIRETHDSYVVQQIVNSCVAAGMFQAPTSLSGAARTTHHPFVASELGSRMDHMKGRRKEAGRSPRHEARGRAEKYWRQ